MFERNACLNGVVHFVARDTKIFGNDNRILLAFHLVDEEFLEMKLPSVPLGSRIATCVFRGLLASLCYHKDGRRCSIMVMKEYKVKDSWVQQFEIEIAGGLSGMSWVSRRMVKLYWRPETY